MEAILTLKADAKDLKPFETMAKKMGISVNFTKSQKRSKSLEQYRTLAKKTQIAGLEAGITPEIIDAEIKAYRKENAFSN
jgi:hypothetical protein